MIDWITAKLPLTHKSAISDGVVVHLDEDGNRKFFKLKRKELRGSFETGIHCWTEMAAENDDGTFPFLWVSGNPVKLFQGHNVWGTDDLHGLLVETFDFLADALAPQGAAPTDLDFAMVKRGAVHLTRVDLTESFHLDSLADCKAWIRAAEFTTRMKHRGRGQMTSGTLYFGKHSERWATKIYAKGQEVREHMDKQPGIFGLPHALEYADRCLRIEHVIRGKELCRLGLDLAGNWDDTGAQVLHHELLSKLEFAEAVTIKPTVLEELPGALRGAYALWQEGHDLRKVYSRPTFYRYRSQLLAHGIDISIQQSGRPDNVIPLVRVLEAVPASVPEWAQGTGLYFEPRRFA
jgi:II/X family phage/plasmid replication protein